MATKLTKKQQGELSEKLTGIIQKSNALQLRLSADKSVNEMNINQISSELNRIHDRAIGKEIPAVISFDPKQSGSGNPSPDNIRPITGYEIEGIGTVYSGELNINSYELTVNAELFTFGPTFDLYGNYGSFSKPLYRNYFPYHVVGYDNSTRDALFMCNAFTPITTLTAADMGDKECRTNRLAPAGTGATFYIRWDEVDLDGLNAFAAEHPIQAVCQIITPNTYTLTPQQMLQLIDQL